MKKLILFGGAFDPIHYGHLNMAAVASETIGCDVLFIPANISIWKDHSINPKEKYEMVELAIKNFPNFHVSDYELNLSEKHNFTINTVRHFKKVYPDYQLYFLIGSCHINSFNKWNEAEELASLAQIIYYRRPGYSFDNENVVKYHMIEIKGKEIDANSTDIRNMNSLLLPEEIINYIEEHNLYYMKDIKNYFDNEKRFNHSKSVAKLSYNIAKANHLQDLERFYFSGLLHDIGKAVKGEKALSIMKEIAPEYISLGEWSYHQFIGAYLAQKDFEIVDESMLKAIRYHATGNEKMDLLGKVVYASDKIDPLRGFDSTTLIKAMLDDVENGFITVLKANKEYLETHKKSINNELTYKCFKYYLDK